MFRALLSQPQKGLHKRLSVYCVRIILVGGAAIAELTLYARNIQTAVCVAPPGDEKVMLATSRGP
jgi:hypothetical protein